MPGKLEVKMRASSRRWRTEPARFLNSDDVLNLS